MAVDFPAAGAAVELEQAQESREVGAREVGRRVPEDEVLARAERSTNWETITYLICRADTTRRDTLRLEVAREV